MPHPCQRSLFSKSQAAQRFHGHIGWIVHENGAFSGTDPIQRISQKWLFNLALQSWINQKYESLCGSTVNRQAADQLPGFSPDQVQFGIATDVLAEPGGAKVAWLKWMGPNQAFR